MIEDIEYLEKNSVKNSQIIYIDSHNRDKYIYPYANEYTFTFDQPFKLVYGFEILDASIPVTMYNVDIYNNTIMFTTVSKNTTSLVPINTESMFRELANCKSFAKTFNDDVLAKIVMGNKSNLDPYISGVISPSETHIMYAKSIITTNDIFLKSNQSPEDFIFFVFNNINFGLKKTLLNQDLQDIILEGDFYLYFNTNNTVDVIYFEKTLIDQTTFSAIRNANAHIISVVTSLFEIPVSNYDIIYMIGTLNEYANTINVDVSSTTADPKRQAKLQFTSNSDLIFLNAASKKNRLLESLGFDVYPLADKANINYKGWIIGDNHLVFGSVFDGSSNVNKIVSPGLISLLGERFAILRVKEIEDHLHGSYAYMAMTPGVGMFKMASAFGGITNLRFDYTTLVSKPFHPIGKLSKISIKFETDRGYLYDFKGVNHQLMINIKYYTSVRPKTFEKSVLNPNYNPDIMQYMVDNQYREESEDEEDFYDDDTYKEYKKEMYKYSQLLQNYDK